MLKKSKQKKTNFKKLEKTILKNLRKHNLISVGNSIRMWFNILFSYGGNFGWLFRKIKLRNEFKTLDSEIEKEIQDKKQDIYNLKDFINKEYLRINNSQNIIQNKFKEINKIKEQELQKELKLIFEQQKINQKNLKIKELEIIKKTKLDILRMKQIFLDNAFEKKEEYEIAKKSFIKKSVDLITQINDLKSLKRVKKLENKKNNWLHKYAKKIFRINRQQSERIAKIDSKEKNLIKKSITEDKVLLFGNNLTSKPLLSWEAIIETLQSHLDKNQDFKINFPQYGKELQTQLEKFQNSFLFRNKKSYFSHKYWSIFNEYQKTQETNETMNLKEIFILVNYLSGLNLSDEDIIKLYNNFVLSIIKGHSYYFLDGYLASKKIFFNKYQILFWTRDKFLGSKRLTNFPHKDFYQMLNKIIYKKLLFKAKIMVIKGIIIYLNDKQQIKVLFNKNFFHFK